MCVREWTPLLPGGGKTVCETMATAVVTAKLSCARDENARGVTWRIDFLVIRSCDDRFLSSRVVSTRSYGHDS